MQTSSIFSMTFMVLVTSLFKELITITELITEKNTLGKTYYFNNIKVLDMKDNNLIFSRV